MKLSVNEAKLRAESCANVHQVLISKFAFGLEKLLPLCLDRRTLFTQTEPGHMILIELLLAAECIKLGIACLSSLTFGTSWPQSPLFRVT